MNNQEVMEPKISATLDRTAYCDDERFSELLENPDKDLFVKIIKREQRGKMTEDDWAELQKEIAKITEDPVYYKLFRHPEKKKIVEVIRNDRRNQIREANSSNV